MFRRLQPALACMTACMDADAYWMDIDEIRCRASSSVWSSYRIWYRCEWFRISRSAQQCMNWCDTRVHSYTHGWRARWTESIFPNRYDAFSSVSFLHLFFPTGFFSVSGRSFLIENAYHRRASTFLHDIKCECVIVHTYLMTHVLIRRGILAHIDLCKSISHHFPIQRPSKIE